MECSDLARSQIWELARDLWLRRSPAWPEPTFGLIIRCGAVRLKNARGREDAGLSQLYRILIVEANHLIWRPKCNRCIEHSDAPDFQHAPAFVAAEFKQVIRSRFDTDTALLNKKRYRKRAMKQATVEATWRSIFPPPDPPLPNWLQPHAPCTRMRPCARCCPCDHD